MIEMYKGEKRLCGVLVKSRKNTDFEIESCECKVYDNTGSLMCEADGIIDGHNVFYFLDSNDSCFITTKGYVIEYIIELKDSVQLLMGRVNVKIKS